MTAGEEKAKAKDESAAAVPGGGSNRATTTHRDPVMGVVVSPPATTATAVGVTPSDDIDAEVDTELKRQEEVAKKHQGLINQGGTCYLSSLLQLLFSISYFREAVYRTSSDSGGIAEALQSLFFQLQERSTACSTKGLTDAFGWSEEDVMVQHDLQELAAKLRDTLEEKMKGTPSEGCIERMFRGFGDQVTETKDKTYRSVRADTFYDIILVIKENNIGSIYDSLKFNTAKSVLDGDNKYKVEEEGKDPVYKDAEMGYQYRRFPPVILFQLKRFEMDLMSPTLDMYKINKKIEFQETLDLSEFEGDSSEETIKKTQITNLSDGSPKFAPKPSSSAAGFEESVTEDGAIYDLHCVLVHRGTPRVGHYYCYIRDFNHETQQWGDYLKYDDEEVSVAMRAEVFDKNFGGKVTRMYQGRQVTIDDTNSAYMLSYIRRSEVGKLIYPIGTDAIPQAIKEQLQKILEEDEKKQKEEEERRKTVRFYLTTPDSVKGHVKKEVYDLMPAQIPEEDQGNEGTLPKSKTFADLKYEIAAFRKCQPEDFRLWRMGVVVQNSGLRPQCCLDWHAEDLSASDDDDELREPSLEKLFERWHSEEMDDSWNEVLYVEMKSSQVSPLVSSLLYHDCKSVSMSSQFKTNNNLLQTVKRNASRVVFAKEDRQPTIFFEFSGPRPIHRISFVILAPGTEAVRRAFTMRVEIFDQDPAGEGDDLDEEIAPIWSSQQKYLTQKSRPVADVLLFPRLDDEEESIPVGRFLRISEIKQGDPTDFMRCLGLKAFQVLTDPSTIPRSQPSPYPTDGKLIIPRHIGPSRIENLPLMIKLYNHKSTAISFRGMILVNKYAPLRDAFPAIRHLCGLPSREDLAYTSRPDLLLYDESRPHPVAELDPDYNCTEDEANLFTGNIVTAQIHPRDIPMVYRFRAAEAFYKHVDLQRFVNIRRIQETHKAVIPQARMQGDWTHWEIVEFLADNLPGGSVDPSYIRLYGPHAASTASTFYYRLDPEKSTNTKRTLDQMLKAGNWTYYDLYYEVLDKPLVELEGNPTLNVRLCDDIGNLVHEPVKVTVKVGCHVSELVQKMLAEIRANDSSSYDEIVKASRGHFAFLTKYGALIVNHFPVDLNDPASCANPKLKLPAWLKTTNVYEVRFFIPPATGEVTLVCGHGDYKQPHQHQPFGTPFLWNVKEDEPCKEILDRMLQRLGPEVVKEEDLDKDYPLLIYTNQMLTLQSMDDALYGYIKNQENSLGYPTHSLICHPKPKEKAGSRYVADNVKLSLGKKN